MACHVQEDDSTEVTTMSRCPNKECGAYGHHGMPGREHSVTPGALTCSTGFYGATLRKGGQEQMRREEAVTGRENQMW